MFYFIFPGELDRTFLYLWPEHIPSDFWVSSPRRIRTRQVFFFKQVYILELFFWENIYKNQLFNFFCQFFFFSWRSREEPGVQRAKKTSWYNALYPSYKSRSEDFKKTFSNLPSGERLIVGKGF